MDNTQPEQITKKQRREMKKMEKTERQEKEKNQKRMFRMGIILVSIVIIVGIGYVVVVVNNNKNDSNSNISAASTANPTLGGEDAKVVITEYSDFTCPACASAAPTIKQLYEEYGDQIRIEFNGFDLNHTWSQESLEAGECALDQNYFWPYHDLLFANQSTWNNSDDPVEYLKNYAEEAGMNREQFSICLDSGEKSQAVADDTSVARSNNIDSTPTFYINDQELVGAKPIDEFKVIIDEELAK